MRIDINRIGFGILIFLFSPVLSVWASIRSFYFLESKILLVLFFGVFGMTMNFHQGLDGYRNVQQLINYENKDFSTYISESKNIILLRPYENVETKVTDLYFHTLLYIVAPFSTKSTLLYFIAALIYGFFYIRGISKVLTVLESRKLNIVLIILISFFIFWKSFEGINSIRNWTAAWIYFNGAFSYFQTKQKKYIFLVALAPLAHFSYLIMTIPFYIILFVGNRPKIFMIILIISYVFNFINFDFIVNFLSGTDLGYQKSRGYVREGAATDYLIERGSNLSFHANYYMLAGKLIVSVLFFYLIIFFGYMTNQNKDYSLKSLASMAILLISLSNFSSFIFALYSRSFNNAALYALAYIIILYSYNYYNSLSSFRIKIFDLLTFSGLPLVLLFIFTQLSQIGEFLDTRAFISPLLYLFIDDGSMSLKEILREIFV